jgi:hypothetical protein
MKTTSSPIALKSILVLAAGFSLAAFAQVETATPVESLDAIRGGLSRMSPVPATIVPECGTFYMLRDYELSGDASPPYPINPYPQAAVYALGGDNVFLVDNSHLLPQDSPMVQTYAAAATQLSASSADETSTSPSFLTEDDQFFTPGQLAMQLRIASGISNTWTLPYTMVGWDTNNPVPEGVGLLTAPALSNLNGAWTICAAQVRTNAADTFVIPRSSDPQGFFLGWSVTYAPGVFFLVNSNLVVPDGGEVNVPFMIFDDINSDVTNKFVVQAIDSDSNRKLSEVLIDGPIGFGNLTLNSATLPYGIRNIHLVGASTDGSEWSQDIQVPSFSSLAVTYPTLETTAGGTNEGFVFSRIGIEAQTAATNGTVVCIVYDDTSLAPLWTNTLDLTQALVPGLYQWPGPTADAYGDGYGFTNSGFLVSITVEPPTQILSGGGAPKPPPKVNPHFKVVRSHPQRGATIARAYEPSDPTAKSFEQIAMQDLALEGLYAGDQRVYANDCTPVVVSDASDPLVWDLQNDPDWSALLMLMTWPFPCTDVYELQYPPNHIRWTNAAPILMKYLATHSHGNPASIMANPGSTAGVDLAILKNLRWNATNRLSFCSLNGCQAATNTFLEALLDNNGIFGHMTKADMINKGVPPHWGAGFKGSPVDSLDFYYFLAQVAFNQCGGAGGSLPPLWDGYKAALDSNPPSQGDPVQTGVDGIFVYDQW